MNENLSDILDEERGKLRRVRGALDELRAITRTPSNDWDRSMLFSLLHKREEKHVKAIGYLETVLYSLKES